jgi:hypothetical protein
LSDTLLKEIFDEEITRPLNYIISSILTPNVIKSVNHAIMVTQVKEKYKIDTKLIEGVYRKLSNSFYYPVNEDRILYGDTTANIVLYNSFDNLMFKINPTFKKVYGTYYSYSASKSIEMSIYELRRILLEDVNLNFDRSRLEVLLNRIDKSKINFGKTIKNETNQQSENILKDIEKMLDNEQIFIKVLSKLKEGDIRLELLNKLYVVYKSKKEVSKELKDAYAKITCFILIYYKHFIDITNLNINNTENPFNLYVSFLFSILDKLSD